MTEQEAKDTLLKLEELINKTNRLYKRGSGMHSLPFIKLHRKRMDMLDAQEEAELIVRDTDPAFYQAWADRVLDKPTSWNFLQFQAEINEKIALLQQAIEAKNAHRPFSFTIDSAEVMKQIHRYLDDPEWRDAVSHSPYYTEEQRNILLHRSDILQEFYHTYDQWTDTLRTVSPDIVDVDEYVRNAYRILWVLPYDLPAQSAPIPTMLREYATWEAFPHKLYAYTKMLYTSFAIQQLYFYGYDKDEMLSYAYINRHASIADWYHSLRQTAIVSLAHTSLEELRQLIVTLQPNFIIAPGSLPFVFSALGYSTDRANVHLLTGVSTHEGTATLHYLGDTAFIQTAELTHPYLSDEAYLTDIVNLSRRLITGHQVPPHLPAEIVHEITPSDYAYGIIREALSRHCYIDALYPEPDTLEFTPLRLLPCLLKKHAGEWYVIGKRPGGTLEPFLLTSMHRVSLNEQIEEIASSTLVPYQYAYGVHLRTDLSLNPHLATHGAQLFVIHLRVHAPLWTELRLHPLHFSQELLPSPTAPAYRHFQYTMYLTDEFIRLLRGYGKQIEILSPSILKAEVESKTVK